MGRYHKNTNPEEEGVAPWVCAVCGKPEPKCKKHKDQNGEPVLIRENSYREVEKQSKQTMSINPTRCKI
jgi:hypothetical protein